MGLTMKAGLQMRAWNVGMHCARARSALHVQG